uniref:SCP domain-containing protein n=2 Tax=Setaria italica TaxID=4555 RepID=K3ZXB0_SETIT
MHHTHDDIQAQTAHLAMEKVACLALAFAMAAAAVFTPCAAQNSPQDFVKLHNAARAAVGVGPVSWNDNVAAFARSWAAKRAGDCRLVHSRGSGYGENLFGGSGADWSASDAVGLWVAEKQWYDHGSNSCAAGKVCGHYTQVVWRASTAIGCARVVCNNGGIFITCNYSPPGNYAGQSPY